MHIGSWHSQFIRLVDLSSIEWTLQITNLLQQQWNLKIEPMCSSWGVWASEGSRKATSPMQRSTADALQLIALQRTPESICLQMTLLHLYHTIQCTRYESSFFFSWNFPRTPPRKPTPEIIKTDSPWDAQESPDYLEIKNVSIQNLTSIVCKTKNILIQEFKVQILSCILGSLAVTLSDPPRLSLKSYFSIFSHFSSHMFIVLQHLRHCIFHCIFVGQVMSPHHSVLYGSVFQKCLSATQYHL